MANNNYFPGFAVTATPPPSGPAPPATNNDPPFYESSDVPGQWDMHAIRLEHVFGYSNNTNSTGAAHPNALGTHSVKLAVIDTGQDTLHPDLANNIVYQKCFITDEAGTSQSTSDFSTDPQGHGTDVTGIAGAVTNFGAQPATDQGFAGAGGNIGIMAYRVFPTPDDNCGNPNSNDNQCGADTLDIDSAIDDAVTNGASVISLSLGGNACTSPGVDSSPDEGAAVANAIAHSVIVVAAAGNESASSVDSPGCDTGVIAVGATSLDDGTPNGTSATGGNATPHGTSGAPQEYVASYSNHGTPALALNSPAAWGIVAPGGDPNNNEVCANCTPDDLHWIENIWTSTPYMANAQDTTFQGECTDDYPNSSGAMSPVDCRTLIAGTSQATPHVAGVAALICGLNPAECNPTSMKTLLCQTADSISDSNQGCGRLDAYTAVATALTDPSIPTTFTQ
jgi:subtilisin family serine protease